MHGFNKDGFMSRRISTILVALGACVALLGVAERATAQSTSQVQAQPTQERLFRSQGRRWLPPSCKLLTSSDPAKYAQAEAWFMGAMTGLSFAKDFGVDDKNQPDMLKWLINWCKANQDKSVDDGLNGLLLQFRKK